MKELRLVNAVGLGRVPPFFVPVLKGGTLEDGPVGTGANTGSTCF